MSKKYNLTIVTPPLPKHNKAMEEIVLNFLDIFEPLCEKIFLVTGNFPKGASRDKKLHIISIDTNSLNDPMAKKIVKYIAAQVKLSLNLFRIPRKESDVVIFLVGNTLLFPMLTTKLIRKKTIVVSAGSVSASARRTFEAWGWKGTIVSHILALSEKLTCTLSNQLVVYSPGMAYSLGVEKLIDKLFTDGAAFVNTSLFKISKAFEDRPSLVGYIGRFSEEKGIINFIKAIPLVLERRPDIKFLIGGGGEISHEVKQELKRNAILDEVTFTGWIHHDALPGYLNEVKLFVLPSFTEGLPSTILEAMACGTVVLATPVGGIPDVIKDEETGFILKNNTPEHIAERIIELLARSDLDKVGKNAHRLITEKYTREAAIERYQKILATIRRKE